MYSWKYSEFCVLSSHLPSCLRSSSVWSEGCCLWLLVDFLAVVNRVCPGWPVGNEGGFRLIVPRKGSDGSPILFCIFGAGDAFVGNVLAEWDCVAVKCIVAYNTSMARR